jgi:FkbM family methyltransferase
MHWLTGKREKARQRTPSTDREEKTHGLSLYEDLARRLYQFHPGVIFDVGANIGQSARKFRSRFPDSEVFCFEPVESTFAELQAALAGDGRVRLFPLALGASCGSARIQLQERSDNNSLRRSAEEDQSPRDDLPSETVEVITLDDFCAQHDIPQIDLLKIDTEGYDLEVLKGAENILRNAGVTLIQVEAGMNPFNTKHIPLHDLQEHLEARGYVLFGLYDQTPEWSGVARLRFCNAVFIHSEPRPG